MRVTDVFIVATSLLRPNTPGGDITCVFALAEVQFSSRKISVCCYRQALFYECLVKVLLS